MNERPKLAITMGDPSGIGPEIIVKALEKRQVYRECIPIVIADGGVLRNVIELLDSSLILRKLDSVDEAIGKQGEIDLIDLENINWEQFRYGQNLASSGKAAFDSISKAIDLALANKVVGVVTAPINKESINLAGFHYSGHTEIFAERTKTNDYAMMLMHESMRVIHVSTHVSLRDACDLVEKNRILSVVKLANQALISMGVGEPRISVAGLNPHAGENGMFGNEEINEIGPAVKEARAAGIDVEGPLPADTLFSKVRAGQYDIAVVMYHDQGHIPLKTLGFQYNRVSGKWDDVSGINITLGLPIIRTSVDHGTAFDRAGEGTANPQSMIEALMYGALLAKEKAQQR